MGIDISDEMIRLATKTSNALSNLTFHVASAEALPFPNGEFSHAFSMESLYYYADMSTALAEICRVLVAGGLFVAIDLYGKTASHQWVENFRLPCIS